MVSKEQEEQEKKRLITLNSGLPKLLRWSHALRSDTKTFLRAVKLSTDPVIHIRKTDPYT
jgi:hypothetical protein